MCAKLIIRTVGHVCTVRSSKRNILITKKSAKKQDDFFLLYPTESGTPMATTPHLITLVELESGLPIQTEEVKFGLRVAAVLLRAPEVLLGDDVIKVVGPRAFGYDMDVMG